MKCGYTWPTMLAPAQPLNSLPALGLRCGANENTLHGALMVVATVAMVTTMAIMAAVATGTREATLLTWGNEMMIFDGNEARAYAADNAGAGATAGQFACTWAALWGE